MIYSTTMNLLFNRGSPAVQANCIYALAGLAATVSKFVSMMDKQEMKDVEDCTEYKSHSHWLTVVMDTIMSLMDINFKPKGRLLGLCQQVYI